jgi:hypothetical protein
MYNNVAFKPSLKTEEYCILLCSDEYDFVLVAICRGLKSEFTWLVTKCVGCEGFVVLPVMCDVTLLADTVEP